MKKTSAKIWVLSSLIGVSVVTQGFASTLYNINFAGRSGSSQNVTNGTVIEAPSHGLNEWNNLLAPTADWDDIDSSAPLTITDADGVDSMDFYWEGSTNFSSTGSLAPLNIGYTGNGSLDSTMVFSNLNNAATYDIYIYFTWNWNENAVVYEIVDGEGDILSLTINPERDTANSYANYVEGDNFILFEDISPNASISEIAVRAESSDGGFSGIQIVETVPEPSSSVLLSLAGLILILRRQK